ncbi:PC-esterase domain-containing protein 1A-like [Seriola dumerili]|uniref:PC-esterase domain-containing protein 1A-like n=1 Tax=Seriola dumerili TaxID=41447 RepID=UPI000BBE4589|nr:PC-esterase domain-containing protein 1A-like [Seriola dumerili]
MKCVSHQQASQLLHNKFIVVLGDSIQRSVYKDLVLLIQKEKYLTLRQLKSKGEMSFEQDCLVEGGCLSQMHNGTQYREVRQFQSAHHLIRFYFVTRIYSRYMQSILDDFCHGLKPDVVIVNSCVWDISRYNSSWIDDYKKNLYTFFDELRTILPEESLVIWNLTMPLAEKIKGGFLVPEIEHKAPQLRYDVIEANFYSGTLADAHGMDVLDLHFQFRFSLHHRTNDGVHWNAIAHRRITSLLLQHAAQAWGVIMPCPLRAVGVRQVQCASNYPYPPANYFSSMERYSTKRNYNSYREEFFSNSLPYKYLSFEGHNPQQQTYRHEAAGAYRPALSPHPHPPIHRHKYKHGHVGNGFDYRPPHHFEPYNDHHHKYVMRSRRSRHHYAPYTHHRTI